MVRSGLAVVWSGASGTVELDEAVLVLHSVPCLDQALDSILQCRHNSELKYVIMQPDAVCKMLSYISCFFLSSNNGYVRNLLHKVASHSRVLRYCLQILQQYCTQKYLVTMDQGRRMILLAIFGVKTSDRNLFFLLVSILTCDRLLVPSLCKIFLLSRKC